ncbi:MAG: cobalamin B12-binding domain-containing protein [Candidatus Edwardsbacteria bacterium]|nr:cobalamin B12-binding domain-containing protein [Candidatus Edwardsbacteria bacterium]
MCEALAIDARASRDGAGAGRLDFILELQPYFGRTMAAVYQFGLQDVLLGEAADLARSFAGRGLDARFLRRMLQAWVIAIHATLRTPDAAELVAPLQWLAARIDELFLRLRQDDPALSPEQSGFLQSLLENRADDALALARAAVGKRPIDHLVDQLLMPVLAEIGRRWSGSSISVADEHLATGNLSQVASQMFAACRPEPSRRKTAAITCVPGDVHALSGELLARYLGCRGWNPLFLGASMPQPDLVKALAAARPYAILVSVRMTAFLPAFAELAGAVRDALPATLLLAGGPARIGALLGRWCDGVPATFAQAHALLERGGRGA